MKIKRGLMIIPIVILIALIGYFGFQIRKAQQYVKKVTDIADSFPIKAKPVKTNPQLVDSAGPYAIIHTTAGPITILLYPEQAPKAVENFITLAQEGYYNGSEFYYVKKDHIVQGGKPSVENPAAELLELPNGEIPKYRIERSKWTEPFEDEFDDDLHNFVGAVGMAGDGKDNNLSQFYFQLSENKAEDERLIPASFYFNELTRIRMKEFTDQYQEATPDEATISAFEEELNEEIQRISTDGVPEDLMERYQPAIDQYQKVGGIWGLDYKMTIFGQIVDGFNVAQAMSRVKVEPSTREPKREIKIESIEIIESDER